MPKRGENIYKRKDGRWEGRYIRGRSPSGRAEYGYVYAGSYRECRAKRQKCLDACREAPVAASSLTLNQAAERFLADKQDDLKRSTLARYTYVLKHYILPVFGAVLLSQLTANQISEFLRRLQKNGLSGKSARDVGVLLKSILRYSAKKLDCPSPGMTVELPAYRRKQIDIFYPDEIQRLAQMIMDEPTTTGIGILLTLNTGLRLGELCALQYKDIDLRNGVVHVRKTVQRIRSGDRTSLMVLPPKSNSARRTIPLPGDMAALLQKLVQSHPNGENYLLTGKNVPMEPRTMQYQYRALLKAAGIPYRNFHTLRHTYASRCVENEVLMYFRSRKKLQGEMSLSDTIDGDDAGSALCLMDVVGSDDTMLSDMADREEQQRIRHLVDTCLTDREAEVIRRRYGLSGRLPQTQRQVAAAFGISRSYVSRIEKRALEKLEAALREHCYP